MMALIAVSGLVISIFFEIAQIFPKVAGGVVGKNSIGANAALKTLLMNRIGAAAFYPVIGWKIDSGAGHEEIATLFLLGAFLLTLILFAMTIIFNRVIESTASFFFNVNVKLGDQPLISETAGRVVGAHGGQRFVAAVAVAGVFGHIGMFGPLLLAAVFPSYRLMISQMGFIFNSIFSVMSVFYIDRRLSSLCEEGSRNLVDFGRYVLVGRMIALSFACVTLIALLIL